MKGFLNHILLAAFLLSVLFACTGPGVLPDGPDEPDNPGKERVVPDGFAELIRAYRDSIDLNYIEFRKDTTYLVFGDDYRLRFTDDLFLIDDCRAATPRVVSCTDGVWYAGSVKIEVPYDTAVGAEDSFPVYAYFTGENFHVYLSNSEHIKFKYDYIDQTYPKMKGSLPKVYITTWVQTKESSIYDEYLENCKITFTDHDHLYSDVDSLTLMMKIKRHGNSTAGFPKVPWHIKLDESSKVLGMKKNRDWYLLANYSDKTLVRNVTGMELSRICEFPWTPAMRHCEVYFNNQYRGVYTLSETHEVAGHRVDIDVDKGDVYLEVDERRDEITYFSTLQYSVPIMFREPTIPTKAAKTAVENQFGKFESSLISRDGTTWDYVDLKTFVDYYIVEELTKNVDGRIYLSTFMTIPKGGKITMYHLWDFDLAMGNCNYCGSDTGPTGWWIRDQAAWYRQMFKDKVFVRALVDRWKELYPQLEKIPMYIDQQTNLLQEAQKRNFVKWDILDTWIWPNVSVTGSYDGEVTYLKSFYTKRLEWLNIQMKSLETYYLAQ